MIVGGFGPWSHVNSTTEIYDPGAGTFGSPIQLGDRRALGTTTALRDGSVLMVGGVDDTGNPIGTVERYWPAKLASEPIGTMASPRSGQTATLLTDGTVLVVGGRSDSTTVVAEADLYLPDGTPAASPSDSLPASDSPAASGSLEPGGSPAASGSPPGG
jgi:hypothetical protein